MSVRNALPAPIAIAVLLAMCVGFGPSAAAADPFDECSKVIFSSPHWSKEGGGVVAKGRAYCPKKYTIHTSLKLFRCAEDPKLNRAWLESNCTSKEPAWNNWCERPGSDKEHDKPCYVPDASYDPPSAKGFYWAAHIVIALENQSKVYSKSKIRKSSEPLRPR